MARAQAACGCKQDHEIHWPDGQSPPKSGVTGHTCGQCHTRIVIVTLPDPEPAPPPEPPQSLHTRDMQPVEIVAPLRRVVFSLHVVGENKITVLRLLREAFPEVPLVDLMAAMDHVPFWMRMHSEDAAFQLRDAVVAFGAKADVGTGEGL